MKSIVCGLEILLTVKDVTVSSLSIASSVRFRYNSVTLKVSYLSSTRIQNLLPFFSKQYLVSKLRICS